MGHILARHCSADMLFQGAPSAAGLTTRSGAPGVCPYLRVGTPDVALDLVHRVCAIGHRAQMQPLKCHFVLGEGSCGRSSNRKEVHAVLPPGP